MCLCFKFFLECCNDTDFNCNIEVKIDSQGKYRLNLTEEILSKQDIVVMKDPEHNYSCMPSQLYNKSSPGKPLRSELVHSGQILSLFDQFEKVSNQWSDALSILLQVFFVTSTAAWVKVNSQTFSS